MRKYDIDKAIARLEAKVAGGKPDKSSKGAYRAWSADEGTLRWYRRCREFLTALGADWYIDGKPGEAFLDDDDSAEISDLCQFNRRTQPLVEGAVHADYNFLWLQEQDVPPWEYVIDDDGWTKNLQPGAEYPESEQVFPTVAAAVDALKADIGKQAALAALEGKTNE